MTVAAGPPVPQGTSGETARFVIGAAVWAPSVHNTRPGLRPGPRLGDRAGPARAAHAAGRNTRPADHVR